MVSFKSNAQIDPNAFGYYEDALRYSQTNPFGTARFVGLGGAGMALGGEIGSIGVNPAGLGVFNRSQFVITPNLDFGYSEANFLGNNIRDEITNIGLANFGVVINFNKGDLAKDSWRGGSLGITYNRTNNFRQNIQYSGANNQNSIIDAMLEQANGLPVEQLGGLAQTGYDHYLINLLPGTANVYDSFVLGFPIQSETIRRRGSVDQVNISYGTNYDDKIYIGGGIGFTNANYSYSRIFSESFTGEPLSQFVIDERLDVNGTGVNLNFGVILRPTNFVRIGASYTSPTWYNFNEESDVFYQSNYNNYDVANWLDNEGNRLILEDTVLNTLNTNTPLFISDYNLRTPSRINTGVSFIFAKYGFISADFEFLDYSNAHVSSGDFTTAGDNSTIGNLYKSVTNVKIGGEYRYSMFRLRAGYSSLGDPLDGFGGVDRSRQIVSLGAGINFGKYFFDVAYANTSYKESFVSYGLSSGGPEAIIDNNIGSTLISFGLNF